MVPNLSKSIQQLKSTLAAHIKTTVTSLEQKLQQVETLATHLKKEKADLEKQLKAKSDYLDKVNAYIFESKDVSILHREDHKSFVAD